MNTTPSGKVPLGVVTMFEPSIKQTEPQSVAYLSMKGPYSLIAESYGRLYGWVGQQGLEPVGMPAAVYLTMPGQTPESESLWELWAPVAGGQACEPDEQGIGIKCLGAETVASAMHKGPYDQIGPVYEQLYGWLGQQGYRPAGPPRELYFSDPEEVPPEEYLTEVQMPVAKV